MEHDLFYQKTLVDIGMQQNIGRKDFCTSSAAPSGNRKPIEKTMRRQWRLYTLEIRVRSDATAYIVVVVVVAVVVDGLSSEHDSPTFIYIHNNITLRTFKVLQFCSRPS